MSLFWILSSMTPTMDASTNGILSWHRCHLIASSSNVNLQTTGKFVTQKTSRMHALQHTMMVHWGPGGGGGRGGPACPYRSAQKLTVSQSHSDVRIGARD